MLPRRDHTVVGIFPDSPAAQRALDGLKRLGLTPNEISTAFPEVKGSERTVRGMDTKAEEGETAGLLAGGTVGGILGWLAGVGLGTIVLPGLGGLIVAGPLLTALSGVAVGGAAGGVIGALVGMGIPEEEAVEYENCLRQGRALVFVRCAGRESEVEQVFRTCGAENIPPSPIEQPRYGEPPAPPTV